MNAQEIFDTVAKHLAKQGHQARNGATCSYRTPNGDKCAVGCLIIDEEYSPEMDTPLRADNGTHLIGTGVESLMKRGLLPERFTPFISLLGALQQNHDDEGSGDDLRDALWRTAEYHNLSPAILDTLTFPDVWA